MKLSYNHTREEISISPFSKRRWKKLSQKVVDTSALGCYNSKRIGKRKEENTMFEADKTYAVIIEEATMEESSKGTPGIRLRCVKPDQNGEPETIFATIWITDGTKVRVAKTLGEIGVDKATMSSAAFWGDPNIALEGKRCSIVTEANEYNGRVTVRVKYVNGPDGGHRPAKPITQETVKSLANAFSLIEDEVPF